MSNFYVYTITAISLLALVSAIVGAYLFKTRMRAKKPTPVKVAKQVRKLDQEAQTREREERERQKQVFRPERRLDRLEQMRPSASPPRDYARRLPKDVKRDPLSFHSLWQRYQQPEVWTPLLIYILSGPSGFTGARDDFQRRRMSFSGPHDGSSSLARRHVEIGTQILIRPEMSGFHFNPPFVNIQWLEDWHCVEFRMQPDRQVREMVGGEITGRVGFYVGPVLLAETGLHAMIGDHNTEREVSSDAQDRDPWTEAVGAPYRMIFVSYSHKDQRIVTLLERAYQALGDQYLRDVSMLRSGEQWNPAIKQKIAEADIFQLCWSEAAKKSSYVEQEWRHALALRRPNFIRPMYWQEPMSDPPGELSEIHFAYVPIEDVERP